VLEYALPSFHYIALGWQDSKSYPNALERLKSVQNAYLIHFEHTVVGQILHLKAHGRMTRGNYFRHLQLFNSTSKDVIHNALHYLFFSVFSCHQDAI
jgi:hypothetical protein